MLNVLRNHEQGPTIADCCLLGWRNPPRPGQVITFYPGAETGWFAASAVLCLCGVLVLCFVVVGAAFSLWGCAAVISNR